MYPHIALILSIWFTAPQIPIAAGPFRSVPEVLLAARACHLDEFRVSFYPSESQGEARLFLVGDPPKTAVRCFNSWMTLNGKRLELLPRWTDDDFTRDQR